MEWIILTCVLVGYFVTEHNLSRITDNQKEIAKALEELTNKNK